MLEFCPCTWGHVLVELLASHDSSFPQRIQLWDYISGLISSLIVKGVDTLPFITRFLIENMTQVLKLGSGSEVDLLEDHISTTRQDNHQFIEIWTPNMLLLTNQPRSQTLWRRSEMLSQDWDKGLMGTRFGHCRFKGAPHMTLLYHHHHHLVIPYSKTTWFLHLYHQQFNQLHRLGHLFYMGRLRLRHILLWHLCRLQMIPKPILIGLSRG